MLLLVVLVAPVASAQETDDGEIPLMIRTKPRLSGVQFWLDGERFTSDANGLALITVSEPGVYKLSVQGRAEYSRTRYDFSMWSDGVNSPTREIRIASFSSLQAGFDTSYRAQFVDQQENRVDPAEIDSVAVFDDEGVSHTFSPSSQPWLQVSRVVPRAGGLARKDASYLVDRVIVNGDNAAPLRPQLLKGGSEEWQIKLSLHSVTLIVDDAFFGPPRRAAVDLTHPDGRVERRAMRDGEPIAMWLPAGSYVATVRGGGVSFPTRFDVAGATSRSVTLFSWLDMTIVLVCAGALLYVSLARRTQPGLRGFRTVVVRVSSAVKPMTKNDSDDLVQPVAETARTHRWRTVAARVSSVVKTQTEGAPEDAAQPPTATALAFPEGGAGKGYALGHSGDVDAAETAALQSQLEAVKRDKQEIEERLKRVLTNLLDMQESKDRESDVRHRLESEHRQLLARLEGEQRDVANARVELGRLRDELEGARWSAVFKNDVQIERQQLKTQLDSYRRRGRELEVQLNRVKSQLHLERMQRKAVQEELEKRRLQLEKLVREREAVAAQLAQAEEQLRALHEIQLERDDLVTKIELQDRLGEEVAASLAGALEGLADERGGEVAGREAS